MTASYAVVLTGSPHEHHAGSLELRDAGDYVYWAWTDDAGKLTRFTEIDSLGDVRRAIANKYDKPFEFVVLVAI